ncbi:MAG: monooxygenase [Actinomycetia bacterium]|nr:monooxygenase [Actinomycetes bacterium]
MADPVPALVTLHVWGVPRRAVPAAALAMGRERRPVRRTPGLRFAKLLGTGDGRTFTVRDADPYHWGLLATWGDADAAAAFEASAVVRRWDARAHERLRVAMTPLTSTGRWAGQQPFGDPVPRRYDGPVAALTRARLRARQARRFWRAVPPVSSVLRASPGLLLALGIGEAPVGLQGTFSVWESAGALRDFAHGSPEHRRVIAQTHEVGWYAEELFARFAVVSAVGSLGVTHLDLEA